jgi:hypothetical protein
MDGNAEPTHVYFLQPIGGGNIKIGSTSKPMQRLTTMLCWSPVPLMMVGSIAGSRVHESQLHKKFAHLRLHSEWFRPEPELMTYIKEVLAAGKFPDDITDHTDFKSIPFYWRRNSAIPSLLRQCGASRDELADFLGVKKSRVCIQTALPDRHIPGVVHFFRKRGLEIEAKDLFLDDPWENYRAKTAAE